MLFHRLSLGLRLSTSHNRYFSSRLASNCSRNPPLPSFPLRTLHSNLFFRNKIIWLAPIAGGLAFYLLSPDRQALSSLFVSPTLIPCPAPRSPSIQTSIFSPAEPQQSISSRILVFIRDRVWEP